MDDYARIFDLRGSVYDQAMRACPDARAEEFLQLLSPLNLQTGMVIGDVPAGGGYLRAYLPAGCLYLPHEPSTGFTGHGGQTGVLGAGVSGLEASDEVLPLPWVEGALDAVVSLAGVHHTKDKTALFRALATVTRPAGRFVLSDVGKGSRPAMFLDGFVAAWNGTGHEGHYLDDGTASDLRDAGWTVASRRTEAFHWRFPDREAMIDFTGHLFNIAAAGPAAIEEAIGTGPGIDMLDDGKIGMRWSLETFVCVNDRPAVEPVT